MLHFFIKKKRKEKRKKERKGKRKEKKVGVKNYDEKFGNLI